MRDNFSHRHLILLPIMDLNGIDDLDGRLESDSAIKGQLVVLKRISAAPGLYAVRKYMNRQN